MKKSPAVQQPLDPTAAAFTVQQAAVYCAMTPWQVRTAIWRGELKASRVGKSLVIRKVDADSYLASLSPVATNSAAWFLNREKGGAA